MVNGILKYNKIIVIGCPGGGKSTFARALGEITKLPVYHLDMLFWNADKTNVDRETFLLRLFNGNAAEGMRCGVLFGLPGEGMP